MENPYAVIVTDVIFPTLLKHFYDVFHIQQTGWGVTVKWGREGILFSCPRDMCPNKHLCQLSFITKESVLTQYFEGPSIFWVRDVHEMMHMVYRSYFKYNVLNKIRPHVLQFYTKHRRDARRLRQTLYTQCKLLLSTMEIHETKQYQLL